MLWIHVVTSTHNLCCDSKIRIILYPYIPQFYYVKVGCKGLFITRTCLPDGVVLSDLVRGHEFRFSSDVAH